MKLPVRIPDTLVKFSEGCNTHDDLVAKCNTVCGNGCAWNAALTHPYSCNHVIDPETCTEDHTKENANIVRGEN